MEMYKMSTQSGNTVSILERDRDNEDLKKVSEEVLFKVFLHEYKLQYVGEDTYDYVVRFWLLRLPP